MQNTTVAIEETEHFAYGVTRMQCFDGQVVIITNRGDMSRHAIDEWFEVVYDTLDNPSADTSIRLCLDLTHPNQGVTPYSMSRIPELYQLADVKSHVQAKIAIVFHSRMLTRIFTGIFKRIGENRASVREEIFLSQDDAMAWLLE
ncbi:MAG TPA: hypothetical protein VJZ27_19145 [Aggregatilineales bacterium]|nr:hypothetical protein [Aggregatilineales bacterium]